MPIAIAIFFLRARGHAVRGMLRQQLTVEAIDLQGFDRRRLTADRYSPPHALAVSVVSIVRGLSLGRSGIGCRGTRHPILSIIGAIIMDTADAVIILLLIAGVVVIDQRMGCFSF